ncbi:hypothetical protein [Mongoliitalea daihaiensis]|uniref:hypothetical protein n=1 Tax=Mongoliitalea daihaiensis TaxID=2782006 RepID=UPI001F2AA0EE|nr:hypothetical protein [Mongoliitalea daihaiensis]UJP64646.1 hypothetical protein IPZ59_17875 [Mongoliitalea daihaiensis]
MNLEVGVLFNKFTYVTSLTTNKIRSLKQTTSAVAKVAAAVTLGVTLGLSPMMSFGEEAAEAALMGISYCQHNIDGNSGIGTFCQITRCAILTGSGSNIGPCGSDESLPGS